MSEQRFVHPTDRRKVQKRLYGSARWQRVRQLVLERDRYQCQIKLKKCRVKANTVDHVVRPEEGGDLNDPLNLRAACRSCNMVRHNAAYFREKADARVVSSQLATTSVTASPSRPDSPRTTRHDFAYHRHVVPR